MREMIQNERDGLGCKPNPISVARLEEVKRLGELFRRRRPFSFVRLGDYDVGFLLSVAHCEPNTFVGDDTIISGTRASGSPGLTSKDALRLRKALETADYLDFHERLWKHDEFLSRVGLDRPIGALRNPDRETSYILPTWVELDLKEYCAGRRVLFCGAEAPLLETLLGKKEFRKSAGELWNSTIQPFFLRPRSDGERLSENLDQIKHDLMSAIRKRKIDTVFLSLGGAAKILCVEIARELGVCAIDFGACLRALTYSGSDGSRGTRSTHTIFYYRVEFEAYLDALERAFPDLSSDRKLAKAHAQLLLEVQKKEIGWSHASFEFDFNSQNLEAFRRGFLIYHRRCKRWFSKSAQSRKERSDFLHFCGTHGLTKEGIRFLFWFNAKSRLRSILPARVSTKATRK
jgi:hypothetical protein